MKRVKLGLQNSWKIDLGVDNVADVFQISKKSYLAITETQMVKFSRKGIERRYNFNFKTGVFSNSLKLVFCTTDSEIYIFDVGDLEHPLVTGYRTEQEGIIKVIYSEDRQLLITMGITSAVFRISCQKSDSGRRVSVIKHDTLEWKFTREMLQYVCYNYKNDSFINGKDVTDGSTLLATYCSKSRLLLTSRNGNEVCFWNEYIELFGRLTVGSDSIKILEFLSTHFAIAITSQNTFFVIDTRLQTAFECGKLTYESVFVIRGETPVIIGATGRTVHVREVCLPYKLWIKTPSTPTLVQRCSRKKNAARIAVMCKGKPLLLYSPRTRKLLVSCKTTGMANPISFVYDRNMMIEMKHDFENDRHSVHCSDIDCDLNRDVVLLPTQGDGISVVSTDGNSAEVQRIHVQVTHITLCKDRNWMYAGVSNTGDLILLDYKTYNECGRYKLTNKCACGVWYHHQSSAIIAGFSSELLRFDLPTRTVIERITMMDTCECAGMSGNLFIVGCKSGTIRVFCVTQNQILDLSNSSEHFHKGEVTGLSFAPKYFVSSGRDQHLKFWDYHMNLLFEIQFPFPLFGCEIMNGKRHILVAAERAILFVNGRDVFGDSVDIYDSATDNFDIFEDPLDDAPEEEETAQDLDSDIEEITVHEPPKPDKHEEATPEVKEPTEVKSAPSRPIPTVSNPPELKTKEDCETQTGEAEPEHEPPPSVVPLLNLDQIPCTKRKSKKRPRPLLSSRSKKQTPPQISVSPKPIPETARVRRSTGTPRLAVLALTSRSKPIFPGIRHPSKQDHTRHVNITAHTLTLSAERFFGPIEAVTEPLSARVDMEVSPRRILHQKQNIT